MERPRRDVVVRLGTSGGVRAPSPLRAPGDAQCRWPPDALVTGPAPGSGRMITGQHPGRAEAAWPARSAARLVMTSSARPYPTASWALKVLFRSVSILICSTGWPVFRLRISSTSRRVRATSLAAVARSGRAPWAWLDGWCSSTFACRSTARRPGAPAASSTAAAEEAWPMQIVATSGRMYCIVS